jgi:Cu(I)/Ag(I) efflux system membrane fusion protein
MNKIKNGLKELWQSSHRWVILSIIIAAFLLGFIFRGGPGEKSGAAIHKHEEGVSAAKAQIWTCSMHPQIRQPKPGKCPICFMDLVPIESGSDDQLGPRQLKLTPAAVKLAEIETAPVTRGFKAAEIRMVGKIEVDETAVKTITARMPGRLDRLFVDYTGITVRKGDHLVSLYSPDLITAQQELIQATKAFKQYHSGQSTVNAVRDKLKLWGLTPGQIETIEKQASPSDHLTIFSPMAGIVVEKHAVEGAYVTTGNPIYTIADLSRLWVKLDAYESDISWLRYGQTVEFETEAFPGDVFTGKIAFIDPVLDPKTRTVKVRVNVPNPAYKLKPGLFVRAVVHSKLSMSGRVMDPELSGKWICPMHPEVVKERPGACDVCGMQLVKAADLGYAEPSKEDKEAPLIIPASAPLITGKRAVVYVAVPGKEGVFEGKEIVLGPRTGDQYIVKEGLAEGEQVVVNGAFKIDSDLQIQAKPSMMSPDEETPAPEHPHKSVEEIPSAFKASIDEVAGSYFSIQDALSSDSLEEAKKGAKALLTALKNVDMELLTGSAHMEWMKQSKLLRGADEKLAQAGDIEAARVQFEVLTAPMSEVILTFGSGKGAIFRFHCPMAFDNKGAYWLQESEDTRNPYFGSSMLQCKDSIEPLIKKK